MQRRLVLLTLALSMASLVLMAPDAQAQGVGPCANPHQILQQHMVTGVPDNDPDGGLVMRAGPGVQSPRVGVLAPGEAGVWPTGACWSSSSGSIWYEIWSRNPYETAWVSSNFLRPVIPEVPALPAFNEQIFVYVPPGVPAPHSYLPPAPIPGFIAVPSEPPYFYPPPPMIPPPLPFHRSDRPQIVVCG